jgi:hypothetical protein
MEFKTTEVDGQTLKGEYFLIQFTFPKEGLERIDGQDRIEEGVKIGAVGVRLHPHSGWPQVAPQRGALVSGKLPGLLLMA